MSNEQSTEESDMNLSLEDLRKAGDKSAGPGQMEAVDRNGDLLEQKKWLFGKRLEYAREFFNYQAQQRMTMFNFFLVFVGFVITGYGALFKQSSCRMTTFLAIAGAILTIVFIFLERRNEELVHISEDVLKWLENDVLFKGYDREVTLPKRRHLLGWMRENRTEVWPLGIFRRQDKDEETPAKGGLGRSPYEHRKWLPRFQYCILALFVALALLPWVPASISVGKHIIPLGCQTCK
jgi:hypothetical protein